MLLDTLCSVEESPSKKESQSNKYYGNIFAVINKIQKEIEEDTVLN